MKILGIDPGSTRVGYGFIKKGAGNSVTLLDYGIIENKAETLVEKMVAVGVGVEKILKKFSPTLVAVEKLYFSKNQKTALEVAHARGVILFVIRKTGIPTLELGPGEIKAAVTGYGNADKQAVAKMTKLILNIEKIVGPDDVSDALAVAIAAASLTGILSKNQEKPA
jgi:crossover junction endodeoxyribonuclease RuvC